MFAVDDNKESFTPLIPSNGGEEGAIKENFEVDKSERPAWKGYCFSCCGLTSKNVKTRRYAKLFWGTTFVLTVIIIILTFTVSVTFCFNFA